MFLRMLMTMMTNEQEHKSMGWIGQSIVIHWNHSFVRPIVPDHWNQFKFDINLKSYICQLGFRTEAACLGVSLVMVSSKPLKKFNGLFKPIEIANSFFKIIEIFNASQKNGGHHHLFILILNLICTLPRGPKDFLKQSFSQRSIHRSHTHCCLVLFC